MNSENPYQPPAETDLVDIDELQLQRVATDFANARQNPPTVMSTLTKWPGTPWLILKGVLGTAALLCLNRIDNTTITMYWPFGFAAMIFGSLLRDIGLAQRVKKLWPIQTRLIDWEKVDEFKRSH